MGCPSSIAAVKPAPRASLADVGVTVVRSTSSQPSTPDRKPKGARDDSNEPTSPRTRPRSTEGSPASNESSQLARSDAALSIQSRSTNSRLSDELNPLSSDKEAAGSNGKPSKSGESSFPTDRPHEQGVPLNSLSIFSPAPLCDRAEYARRFGGGFHDLRGIYFPTPEERYATLQTELAAVHGGADPLSAITGRGTLWVHQFLADGLPQPLEGFRAELYNPDDEPRLLRFQIVVQQTTKLCLHRLLRRASAAELNVCMPLADELVKQSNRTPCTEQLKVVLQQQAVKLHDLHVAVVSPDVILSAIRHDDPNRLRAIFVSQRHDSDKHHKTKSTSHHIMVTSPASLDSPRLGVLRGRSPSLTPSPARSPPAQTTTTVSPPRFTCFSEFVFAALRDEAEYSLLTTLTIASRPSSRTRDV